MFEIGFGFEIGSRFEIDKGSRYDISFEMAY